MRGKKDSPDGNHRHHNHPQHHCLDHRLDLQKDNLHPPPRRQSNPSKRNGDDGELPHDHDEFFDFWAVVDVH